MTEAIVRRGPSAPLSDRDPGTYMNAACYDAENIGFTRGLLAKNFTVWHAKDAEIETAIYELVQRLGAVSAALTLLDTQ